MLASDVGSDLEKGVAKPLRQMKDLPGPKQSLFLGNLMQFKPTEVQQRFESWAKEFGSEFAVYFGKMPILVLTQHDAISKVLRDRPDGFTRSTRVSEAGREMGLTPGLFSAEGDLWRKQRRMVMASFSPNQIRSYFPSMLKVAERLHRRWLKAAQAGQAIALQDDLMRYTVDTITGLAFGSDVNTLEAGDNVIQEHLNAIFPAIARRTFMPLPYWRFFKLPVDRQLDKSVALVNEAIENFIREARARLRADPQRQGNPPNLLESFIVSAEEADSQLSDADITGNVLSMLLAGEDTTANTMAWMLHLLHQNPQVLSKLVDEVRGVMQGQSVFSADLLNAMPYLDACINETMRLKPVAPFLPVQAPKDTVVGDVLVPKGGLVWNLLRHDAVSENHLEQAAAFVPERWMGEVASKVKGISMPFGSGPRMCPGRYLALLEMKLGIAMVMLHFDLKSVRTAHGGEPKEIMKFTMTPEDLFMQLSPRVA